MIIWPSLVCQQLLFVLVLIETSFLMHYNTDKNTSWCTIILPVTLPFCFAKNTSWYLVLQAFLLNWIHLQIIIFSMFNPPLTKCIWFKYNMVVTSWELLINDWIHVHIHQSIIKIYYAKARKFSKPIMACYSANHYFSVAVLTPFPT